MIIYNTADVKSKYVRKDEVIIEINSQIRLEDLLEKLRRGEELTENDAAISAYKVNNGEFITQERAERSTSTPVKMERDSLDDAWEYYGIEQAKTPELYDGYEKFIFGRPDPDYMFIPVEVTKEQLMDQLYSALGIMPTLKNVSDKTVAELKKMSASGDHLYWPFKPITKFNTLPDQTDIENYEKLNEYEKRCINESTVNPKIVLYFANRLKQNTPGKMLTKHNCTRFEFGLPEDWQSAIESAAMGEEYGIYDLPLTANEDQYIAAQREYEGNEEGTPQSELLRKADEIFKAKFHGHSPRVLKEYLYAHFWKDGKEDEKKTADSMDEYINKLADAFDQKNVSKVAKYKSYVLLAFSESLNYNEMREDHIQALAVYGAAPYTIRDLERKGFVKWYQAHKDISTGELVEVLQRIEKIRSFDVNKDAKRLILEVENAKGMADCASYEQKYGFKFEDNEIALKGRHTVAKQGKMRMYILDKDDYRNFTVGYDTHCCQHYGNAGEACVWKLATDPFSACVVIERDGKILAQSFIWADVMRDTLVFDNIEFANDREVSQFKDIIAGWCRAMPYANIHMGTGYNQLTTVKGFGREITRQMEVQMPTTIGDRHCYTDYHSSGSVARALKTNGEMLIEEKVAVSISTKPDEPTAWDELASPATAFMLNDCNASIESRLSFARAFNHDQTPEIQMEAVRRNLNAISYIEHPTPEVQNYVIERDITLASKINAPTVDIQKILVRQDPSYIKNIQNPDEETCIEVVKKNGMLITSIQNPTDKTIAAAVEQNGYAIREIPVERQTESIQMIAVKSSPKVVSILNRPSERVIRKALDYDPHVAGLVNMSEGLQMYAVSKDPSVINEISEPSYNAIRSAVEKNGLLVRNFQYQYPQLRSVAIHQNPFAVNALKNPTDDEFIMAVSANRAVARSIRNAEKRAEILNAVDMLSQNRDDDGIELE